MRKVWICAIHGLSCAKYRSILCATKYGFVAHSMDCPAVSYAQSMDLRNLWIVLCNVAIDTLRNKAYMDLLRIKHKYL